MKTVKIAMLLLTVFAMGCVSGSKPRCNISVESSYSYENKDDNKICMKANLEI